MLTKTRRVTISHIGDGQTVADRIIVTYCMLFLRRGTTELSVLYGFEVTRIQM